MAQQMAAARLLGAGWGEGDDAGWPFCSCMPEDLPMMPDLMDSMHECRAGMTASEGTVWALTSWAVSGYCRALQRYAGLAGLA